MPAGLQALGDDDIGAMPFEPARLLHRGGRALDHEAGALQPLQQALLRQPVVEADDAGPHLYHRAHIAASNGALLPPPVESAGSMPCSA